jgi:nucleotide-binding universal stress UspA family protein
VVVVPPRALYGTGARIGIRRALIPLDESGSGLSAINRFLRLVKPGTLEYVLLRAVRLERVGDRVLHVQAEQASTQLQELAARCRARGDIATTRVVEALDPAAAIVEAARTDLVDLIVMSTRGEGGIRRLMHGSIANRVARASDVPVCLVKD